MAREDFLDRWLNRRKNSVDPNSLSRYAIRNDKYDREDFYRLLEEMKDFAAMREKLTEGVAGELGYDVYGDLYWSFTKVDPEMVDDKEMRPDRIVNRFVMDEAQQLADHQELRIWTQGDDVGAALAVNTVEPDVETIYDRLQEAAKMANELQQMMQQQQQMAGQQVNLDEMIDELQQIIDGQGGTPTDEQSDEMQSYEEQGDNLAQSLQEVQQQIEQQTQALQDELNGARPDVKAALKSAFDKAANEAEQQAQASEAWGLEPGQLQRMNAQERIELAKRFNTPKFRKIAELFGPMKRMAFAEQRRKVNFAPEEVYDIETGNLIPRLLPAELAMLDDPDRELIFFKNFLENQLLQYAMRGYERVAKGGIICCIDGSGSMNGQPDIWAKAVGLTLLHISRKDKRSFRGIEFGSPGQIQTFDFTDTRNLDPQQVIDFAEFFFNGGTDFQTPLTKALEWLQKEHAEFGAVKGDIVFITDGQCGVNDQWLTEFKAQQAKLGFQVWGVLIGGSRYGIEPLATICDGKVATIESLQSGEGMRGVFGGLGRF